MLDRTLHGNERQTNVLMELMLQDHLTPADVGRTAKPAGDKTVVLTHFVPGTEKDGTDLAKYPHEVRENFSGRVLLANDLARF